MKTVINIFTIIGFCFLFKIFSILLGFENSVLFACGCIASYICDLSREIKEVK